MITSLNQKALRARQVGRKIEGLLRLSFCIFVIAELRPSGSQGRVRKRESGFRRYRRLQKIARPERIKGAQPDKSLGVQLRGLAPRRQRNGNFRSLFARHRAYAQFRPQMLPRAGNKIEQMALRSRLGESTARFDVSRVLQPEIKANLPVRFRAKHGGSAYNYEIRPELFADSRQPLGAQAV